MPGAPNRPPPPATPEVPTAAPIAETPERKVLRRLAPSRVALKLDSWKAGPTIELIDPFDKAEDAYQAGEYATAIQALDKLSIRFTEPRWPSLPEPFKRLRVPIPPPMPPHWDPEHGLTADQKEAKRAARAAQDQLALARASVGWATAHAIDLSPFTPRLEEAATILEKEGVVPAFYDRIDAVWTAVRERVDRPKPAGGARPPPSESADG